MAFPSAFASIAASSYAAAGALAGTASSRAVNAATTIVWLVLVPPLTPVGMISDANVRSVAGSTTVILENVGLKPRPTATLSKGHHSAVHGR